MCGGISDTGLGEGVVPASPELGIIPGNFNFVVILRRRHTSNEQGNSENEQTSNFHVNLLADLFFLQKRFTERKR